MRKTKKRTTKKVIVEVRSGIVSLDLRSQPNVQIEVHDYDIDGAEGKLHTDKDGKQYTTYIANE